MKFSIEDIVKILSRLWIFNMAGIVISTLLSYDLTTGVAIWSNITPILVLIQMAITTIIGMLLSVYLYDLCVKYLDQEIARYQLNHLQDGSPHVDWAPIKSGKTANLSEDKEVFELPVETEDIISVKLAGLPDTPETALDVAKMVLLTNLPEEIGAIVDCIEGDLLKNETVKSIREEQAPEDRKKFDAYMISLDSLQSGKTIINEAQKEGAPR